LYLNKQEEWDDKADKACGLLTLGVEPSQHIIFKDVSDNHIKNWMTLEATCIQKQLGKRVNIYNDFLIRENESESLQTNIKNQKLDVQNAKSSA